MRRFDRQKDVRGRTYRSLATDPKSWARLCAIAVEGRKTSREAALLLALWCYCRHPRNINLADKLHGLLAEHDRACLMVVHDRRTKNVLAAAAPQFDREAVETLKALVGAEVPEGFSFAATAPGDGQRPC
jgi:hypothetical protein